MADDLCHVRDVLLADLAKASAEAKAVRRRGLQHAAGLAPIHERINVLLTQLEMLASLDGLVDT